MYHQIIQKKEEIIQYLIRETRGTFLQEREKKITRRPRWFERAFEGFAFTAKPPRTALVNTLLSRSELEVSWFPRGNDPSLNNRAGGEILSEISRGNRSPPSVFNYERRRRRRRRNASRPFSLPRLSTLERKRKRERIFYYSRPEFVKRRSLSRGIIITIGSRGASILFYGRGYGFPARVSRMGRRNSAGSTFMTDLGPRLMATSRRNRARNNTVAVPIKRKLVARDNVWHVLMSRRFILPHLSCRRIGVSCAQGMRGRRSVKVNVNRWRNVG